MRKLIKITLILLSLVLAIAPMRPLTKIQALGIGLPFGNSSSNPGFDHIMTASPGGDQITDAYYRNDTIVGTNTLTLYASVLSDSTTAGHGLILYSIGDITSPDIPFYFGLNIDTLVPEGLFKYKLSDKKFHDFTVADITRLTFPVSTEQQGIYRQYLLDLFYNSVGTPEYPGTHSIVGINTGIPQANASVDCPDIEIQNATKKVAYAPLASGDVMYNKDQTDRYTAGRPPGDALMYIKYKPPGSPVYLSKPIKEVKIDTKTVNGNPVDFFSIQADKLAAGEYSFVTTWAVKSVDQDKGSVKIFDNMNSGYDLYTEVMRASTANVAVSNDFKLENFWPMMKTIGLADIPAVIGISNNKKDVSYAAYGASSVFTVGADGTIAPAECPDLNVVRNRGLDSITEGDQKQDFCGPIDARNIINWVLCELLDFTRGVADWAQEKSFSIFGTMTNIEVNTDTTPVTTPDATSPPTTFNNQNKSKILARKPKSLKQKKFIISRVYV